MEDTNGKQIPCILVETLSYIERLMFAKIKSVWVQVVY